MKKLKRKNYLLSRRAQRMIELDGMSCSKTFLSIRKLLVLSLLLLAGTPYVSANNVHVKNELQQDDNLTATGVVVDEEGELVIGATVAVKGTQIGTMTDIDGKFSLKVKRGNVLTITFTGMEKEEITVKDKTNFDIKLRTSAVMLNEIVAIGYGTANRKDFTGSMVSVRSEDIAKVPVSDVTQALVGRVAGVHVSRNEGEPGSGISIRVRGGMSITQSNDPLYIIDGFPSEDGMSTLDPADIESIDILKDASATAVYGARGANGVIVVTTKTGAQGGEKFSISYDTYVGVSKLAKKLKTLSTKEYAFLDFERREFTDADIDAGNINEYTKLYGNFADIDANYSNRPGINWQDEALGGSKISQNHRVSIAGGDGATKYNMSYAYFDEEGLMKSSSHTKHNVKLKVDHKATDKITVSGSINFDQSSIEGLGTSGAQARFNKMGAILTYRPTVGVNGDDNSLLVGDDPLFDENDKSEMQNPLVSALAETRKLEKRTVQMNGSISYNIIKGLTFKNTTGARYSTRRNDLFFGARSQAGRRSSINGSIRNTEDGNFQTSNVLTYNGKKGKHKYTAMVGQEYVSAWFRWFEASASNFPGDALGLNDLGLGQTPGRPQSFVNFDDKLMSFFTRLNYSYDDKYLFAATMRADGSSKFGDDKKWGYFPSISGAWRMSEEQFVKSLSVFSDLKLRVGYGLAGNNRIPSYGSLSILGSLTYPNDQGSTIGFARTQIPNPDLQWEANKTLNLGLDMGFFDQRLTITPEFYINRSSNLLLETRVPTSSGFGSMWQNAGETQNVGFDLTISSVNINTKDFYWSTNLNLSHNKNKVRKLNELQKTMFEQARFGWDQNNYLIEEGKSLGRMYGFKTAGVYQVEDFDYDAVKKVYTIKAGVPAPANGKVQPGSWKFENVDDSDNVIDDNDRTVIGNANPYLFGGLTNTFTYKNFDLSVFLNFSLGGDVMNATKLVHTLSGRKNYSVLDVANSSNRWVTIGDDGKKLTDPTQLAALNKGKTIASYADSQDGNKYMHSWAVEDASFLRLENISLGYTIPQKFLKKTQVIKKLRLYATANNIYVFTKYKGFDPEVSTMGDGLTRGVDWGAYPRSRSFVFGASVSF